MKTRMIALLLICSIAAALTACGGSTQPKGKSSPAQTAQSAAESAAPATDQNETNGADPKILIAYFAVAENSDVDAVSSASAIMDGGEAKGMSKYIADIIAERAGGELFSIQTEEKFPGQYDPLANRAKEMQNDGELPPLTSHIENLDDYDTVFLVYPVWWYTVPMPIYSLLDEYDFSGKTIIPVITHAGSRDGGTLSVLRTEEPNATVLDDAFVSAASGIAGQKAAIESWLDRLQEYWK